ncbi:STAS domain-containing protein [Trinickia caryophylli]|uniref:Anti-anti-sigma regulatory factor (Antagonist of anti-sigma factor) n=1 Tax=Trinickia caryophylli TaxID=28094 RepID=A0A1X7E0I5_TRICW|nr:STAS domain-containing protein [Trinickia caryophylli]PMS14298.1 STAS domain-containing protein [Trinickia caryophylli]TRX17781.1 STAS domain-containing protein [Trinickia caryophylli]WQE11453.1 STAS domain-containing protein [Trinickia caryophylli]SMF25112.1 Anti-anti-sigma regulatory factor (antagonist of anti-sigma factor) [Trinickia caryophylli]GLU32618.1 hypothetical protein Busp01_24600 [Trinickia caryophylli]
MTTAITVPIDIPMTIYHAAELKDVLLASIEEATHVRFDLSAVSEIDCAGAQLLFAARRSADERRHACEFVAASEGLRATLTLLGLGGMLAGGDSSAAVVPELERATS